MVERSVIKELLSSKYFMAIEPQRSQIGRSRAGRREDGKLLLAKCLIRRISYRCLGERWMRLERTKRRRGCGTWRIHLGEFADKVGPPRLCITAPRGLPHDDSKNFYSPYNYG